MKPLDVEILLVEDNLDDARLAIRALQKKNLGDHILHVKDGAEALDYVFARGAYLSRDMEEKPKLILLDMNMPKVSGIEVLQRIKSDTRTQAIPIVILTSSDQDPEIDRCYALGVNSCILKPLAFEDLVATIAQVGFYWLAVNQSP